MSRFKGFTRIAASFDPMEIRLAVTALKGAGFTTITPSLRMTETMPMNSLAFGPLEIYVPDGDAENSMSLLEAVADGTMITYDTPDLQGEDPEAPIVKRKGLFMNLLAFFLVGISNPLRGLSVERRARQDRD
ncbi:MAG: hypothetical protein ABJ007_00815 [Pseudophaeobacter sp.]|uniref:hypothetical protein n=1 Tax=Pseudophaeobacter sp. TaxID=1971739 RepID=UPI003297FF2F